MTAATIPGVPFDEAIAFFRQKVDLPTRNWRDLWEGMHARAFTVAGAMRDDLLADLRQAVDKAIADGTTLAEFRRDFDGIVAKHGWSYRGTRARRTETIFRTNVRTAYAAGRWQQIQRTRKALPYLRYAATLDGRTRPTHRTWHGTVLPVEHPWWSTHYPPNGWNCRCSAVQLSARQLERLGLQVSPDPPVDMERRAVVTADGVVAADVPRGIDPGWGYHVGEAAWGRSEQLAAMDRHGPWEPLFPPAADAVDLAPLEAAAPRASLGSVVRRGDEVALRQALRDAIGGDEATFHDPTGERVRITQALVDHVLEAPARRWDGREAFFPFIPELIEQPSEIWVGFARSAVSGRVSLRRRYVRVLDLGTQARNLTLIADAVGGLWSGLTFLRGDVRYLERLRSGLRAWRYAAGAVRSPA